MTTWKMTMISKQGELSSLAWPWTSCRQKSPRFHPCFGGPACSRPRSHGESYPARRYQIICIARFYDLAGVPELHTAHYGRTCLLLFIGL
jgi:hypothetical protein